MEECFSLWFAAAMRTTHPRDAPGCGVSGEGYRCIARAVGAGGGDNDMSGCFNSRDCRMCVLLMDIYSSISFVWWDHIERCRDIAGNWPKETAEDCRVASFGTLSSKTVRTVGRGCCTLWQASHWEQFDTTFTIHSLFQCPIRHEHRAEDLTETRLASSRWWFETIWGTTPRAEGVAVWLLPFARHWTVFEISCLRLGCMFKGGYITAKNCLAEACHGDACGRTTCFLCVRGFCRSL